MAGARSVALVLLAVASCHLASTPAVDCPPGTHVDLGRCMPDPNDSAAITITAAEAGTTCAVTPDPYTAAAGQPFHFVNEDTVDHDVVGADGQLWASVPKGQPGPDTKIDKPGTWAYTIAGCQGGSVVVQ
jgi:plastocyanin